MASAAHAPYMSVEEYLSTTFRPDVDYIDGQIEERNLGEMDHGTLQGVLFGLFFANRRIWNIWPALDARVQVSALRFRVPDLAVVRAEQRSEQIIRTPPLLCIEILSPEDTLRRMLARIEDYYAMGVRNVWIVDPKRRSVFLCESVKLPVEQASGTVRVGESEIAIPILEIFSALDSE